MGQKVNPIGLRLGVNRTWDSRWYDDRSYAKLLAEDLRLRHARYALDLGDHPGVGVVVQEELVGILPVAVEVHVHEHAGLHRGDDHAFALHEQRQVRHNLVHTRFHTHDRLVGIGPWFEDHADGTLTGTGGIGGNVSHILNPVDGLFQCNQCGFNQYIGTGTRISDKNVYCRRGNVWELRNG